MFWYICKKCDDFFIRLGLEHRENKEERKGHPFFFLKCVFPIKKNIGLDQLPKITFKNAANPLVPKGRLPFPKPQ